MAQLLFSRNLIAVDDSSNGRTCSELPLLLQGTQLVSNFLLAENQSFNSFLCLCAATGAILSAKN